MVDSVIQIWNNLNSWLSNLNSFQEGVLEKLENTKLVVLPVESKIVSMRRFLLWKYVQTMFSKECVKEESGG